MPPPDTKLIEITRGRDHQIALRPLLPCPNGEPQARESERNRARAQGGRQRLDNDVLPRPRADHATAGRAIAIGD